MKDNFKLIFIINYNFVEIVVPLGIVIKFLINLDAIHYVPKLYQLRHSDVIHLGASLAQPCLMFATGLKFI